MMMGNPLSISIGEIAALVGAVCFGMANVAYRSQRKNANFRLINTLKVWESLLIFTFLVLFLGLIDEITRLSTEVLLLLSISVILGIVIGDLIYLKGQELAGVSRAYPIGMSFPFTTYLLEIVFLNEHFRGEKGFSILVIILGIILIGKSTKEPKNTPNSSQMLGSLKEIQLGIFLAILASLLWSMSSIILKIGVEDVDPITASFIRTVTASLVLIPIFLSGYYKKDDFIPSQRTLLIILLAGFTGMTLGTLLYVTAVKEIGASSTAALTAISPLITAPLSVIFLKENVSPLIILGTLLTVGGVLLLVL